ncbi:MAG: hypothetical protein IPP44_01765 [Ideonella sp.]|jgi:hypothetical protein|nr:hypothetical protein [Ideonella sp.]
MTDAKAKGQMPRPGDQPQVRAHPVAHLLGVLYQHAAPAERSRLIEVLMRPLSLLCLAAVSGGVFTAIRLRSGWANLQVRLEDTLNIRAPDVTALADMALQVDAETLESLRSLLTSPALAGTAAAMLLLGALTKRHQAGHHIQADTPANPEA